MIRFVWNLHFKCNYRCEYCNFDGQWQDLSKWNKYYSVDKIVSAWDRIYDRYGSVEIHFIGGEPCIYPNFTDLAVALSEKHYLGITTNLSINFNRFIEEISPQRVKFGIGASFHPGYTNFESFFKKAKMFKDKDFRIWVNYVAYIPQLEKMSEYKEKFSEYGFPFVVQPYRGEYHGKDYPEAYTESQRKLIREIAGDDDNTLKDMKYQLERKKTKGKLCRAGQVLAHIRPDGGTKRCGDIHELMGNIFNEDFQLLDKPLPCPVDYCPCDYLYLVDDVEEDVILSDEDEIEDIIIESEISELVEDLLKEAEYYLFKLNDFDSAEELTKRAIYRDNSNTWAIRLLARIYREKAENSCSTKKQKNFYLNSAYAEIKKAINIDNSDPWVNAEMACVLLDKGDIKNAYRKINNSLKFENDNKYFRYIESKIQEKEKKEKVFVPSYDSPDSFGVSLVLAPGWGREAPSYTLALLAGILRNNNFDTSVFDINNLLFHEYEDSAQEKQLWNWEEYTFWTDSGSVCKYIQENDKLIDTIVDNIFKTGSSVIGFSVYFTTKLMSLEIAKRIKNRDDNKIIIFGGTECQRKVNWNELIKEEVVDAVILDDADSSFPHFLKKIRNTGQFEHCKGVVFKKNKKIIDCGDREPMKLDNIPFADYSDFDFNDYGYPDTIKIAFSRGCTEGCAYCSARQVWNKYRTMSGNRIFEELKYQIEEYHRNMGDERDLHIMFLDSLVNGNMQVLKEWTEKLADFRDGDVNRKNFRWSAQVIIRPEMTFDIIKTIKDSGCLELNYGIESGSSKVLNDMMKRYTPEVAEKVVRNIYKVGISAKANFMVGFPTETEKYFRETLDFVKKNGKYIEQIYISRTFCSLERFSYLTENKEKFGVLPHTSGHHLFWESDSGKNNYLVRLDRYVRFCKLVSSFRHKPLVTGVENIERDKWLWLGKFYQYKNKYKDALDCYQKYIKYGGTRKSIAEAMKLCRKGTKTNKIQQNKTYNGITESEFHRNARLNDNEFRMQKIKLDSTPHNIFMQIDAPCNHDCIFCSRPQEYSNFSLSIFKERFRSMFPVFNRAIRIHLTGAGEFLLLPDAASILSYFDTEFPFSEKIFATNGTTFTPETLKVITYSKSRFTIQISLHADCPDLHKELTGSDDFDLSIANIKKMVGILERKKNINLFVMFLITSRNIECLPDFIKMVKELGIKKIKCEYNSIYNIKQKPFSCYFKQSLTNKILDKAEKIAEDEGIEVILPPKFNQPEHYYTSFVKDNTYFGKSEKLKGKCSEVWQNVMLNYKGEIMPCCYYEKGAVGNIFEKDFSDIWNGETYIKLRKSIAGMENINLCDNCLKFNPVSIDNIEAHVITRGKDTEELDSLLNSGLKNIKEFKEI